ncbi:probable DNA repair/recombination protein Rec2 [Sporisorium scitamineum]|uniref:Probable DNA repair/recombination protein Rec2 n=1 Tax=Sporisorium scitamineum TaxID=49012 RepID=A0A127ZJ89_9BASI|nr:probable DNA repair/recombination protein Rec2 [Sporisorium scitamineum]
MSSLAIADVPWISKRIKACCRRAKLFSTDEILLSQPQQLQQALRISQADTDLLILQVATASAPTPVSVLDALNGKRPVRNIDDPTLFDAAADGNDADSADLSDSSSDAGEGEQVDDSRLPSSSIVLPTQGYDGNFPGMQRFVYDSDSDSNSDAHAASDVMMHEDVELPSTFRRTQGANLDNDEMQHEELHNALGHDTARPTIARDVLSLGREGHTLSSGAAELDELLGGGFRTAVLTEIVGESGSGKTQMAIQACTFAALGFTPLSPADEHDESLPAAADRDPNEADTLRDILQGFGMTTSNVLQAGLGACYITSGGERGAHSIVNRALELASFAINERFDRVYPPDHFHTSQGSLDRHVLLARVHELGRDQVLRNLHVACVADVEALEHALKYSLPGLMARLSSSAQHTVSPASPEVGIVVVDNLPSLFQEDPVASDIDSLVQRSKMLVEIADALKRLAVAGNSAGRAVIVLNHVSDAFGIDKEIARRFVFDSADQIRFARAQRRDPQHAVGGVQSALPDYPAAMEYASQSTFVSGLFASVPPTLAEAIGARAVQEELEEEGPLWTLHPRTAQLGHTWSNLINVRLFLSKTKGRVCVPDQPPTASPAAAKAEGYAEEGIGKQPMTTVRKAAVVLNPFGTTMLDTADKPARQLRFVITPRRAVHPLHAYNTIPHAGAVPHEAARTPKQPDTPQVPLPAAVPLPVAEGQEELFGEALQEHDWLLIDHLVQSSVLTPSS